MFHKHRGLIKLVSYKLFYVPLTLIMLGGNQIDDLVNNRHHNQCQKRGKSHAADNHPSQSVAKFCPGSFCQCDRQHAGTDDPTPGHSLVDLWA